MLDPASFHAFLPFGMNTNVAVVKDSNLKNLNPVNDSNDVFLAKNKSTSNLLHAARTPALQIPRSRVRYSLDVESVLLEDTDKLGQYASPLSAL
jgi:hypothetical protein